MSDNTIQMREKENPPRKKEEFSKLTITVSINGEPKNDKTCKSTSLKMPKPLVKKVEGPFSEKGKLVEEMIEGQEYIFKATKFQESTLAPIKHIWWAEKLDDGEIIDLEYKKGVNPYLDDKKVVCFKYKAKKAKKIRIYAYVASPAENISVEVPIVSFPFIIARSVRRAGKCYQTDGQEVTREDITNLNISYPQEKAKLKQKLEAGYDNLGIKYNKEKPKEIAKYQLTKDRIVKDALEYIEEYNEHTDDELFKIMRNDLDDWAMGDLDDNLHKMINFFKSNPNTSNQYEDKRLAEAVAKHDRTQEFIDGFRPLLERDINKNAHRLSQLKVKDITHQFIKKEYDSKENGNPEILGVIGMQDLKSLTYPDRLTGLGISVDGTQAYDITLTEFRIENNQYTGKIKLEIYDHFGLDSSDILKDKNYIRHHEEFICWFMLQHLRDYKPFITHIPLQFKFEGTLNKSNLTILGDED